MFAIFPITIFTQFFNNFFFSHYMYSQRIQQIITIPHFPYYSTEILVINYGEYQIQSLPELNYIK